MKEKLYSLTEIKKDSIASQIRECLGNCPEILFAYLHGSFVASEKFRDIDVAVFLGKLPPSPLEFELSMEAELCGALRGYPVDVRVLNNAPLSFRYNVIKFGKRLFAEDDDARCDFEEAVLSNYFDFAPFRKRYLEEVLGLGS
jgi:predicted nucleotidyltransferase